jgi:predicted ATPase
MPFLSNITINTSAGDEAIFPFNIPAIKNGLNLKLEKNVTFFVGENGAGKSTVLECIAEKCNFNLQGGNRNHNYNIEQEQSALAKVTKLGWSTKTGYGFFMRAESYFNFANYIDEMAKEFPYTYDAYGGKSLHHQSHGESFLSLFTHKFDDGIFLLDEPEAALSPQRQLTFLSIINELEQLGIAQFIIATHSPILLSYPGAQILNFDDELKTIKYQDTEHYNLTRNFLNNPEMYLRHLIKK